MLNKSAIIITAFFLLLLPVTVSAEGDFQRSYRTRISWPAVEGAGGYSVEIQNFSGETVFKKESDETVVYPFLPIGEYTLKVTVLDRFKKPASESERVTLTVIKNETPEVDSISPSSFPAGSSYSAEIKGYNFIEGCSVYLVKGGLIVEGQSLSFRSSSSLRCSFDLKNAEPGDYAVVVHNPSGKKNSGERKVTILPDEIEMKKHAVAVRKASPSSFFIRGKSVELEILGANLSKESSVSLSNGTSTIPLSVNSWDGARLSVTVPSDKMAKGAYDLTVKQSGVSNTLPRAVKMKDPAAGLLGMNGLFFGTGYQGMIVQPSWNSVLENSLIGGNLYFGHLLNGLPFFHDSFLTRHFGLEFECEGYSFKTKKARNRMNGTMYAAPVCGGIYASFTPFSIPFEFIVRGDAGSVISYLSVEGGGLQKSVLSSDFCGSAGASLRYTFSDFFFTEAGSGWSYFAYAHQSFQGLHFFARAGLRL